MVLDSILRFTKSSMSTHPRPVFAESGINSLSLKVSSLLFFFLSAIFFCWDSSSSFLTSYEAIFSDSMDDLVHSSGDERSSILNCSSFSSFAGFESSSSLSLRFTSSLLGALWSGNKSREPSVSSCVKSDTDLLFFSTNDSTSRQHRRCRCCFRRNSCGESNEVSSADIIAFAANVFLRFLTRLFLSCLLFVASWKGKDCRRVGAHATTMSSSVVS
mmetsp:Transcript_25263/g.37301  ORF Transcript_25263/g.37301 Transcript_25263/m.37301 type:complete len:216 (+) Transcript_25263:590-1237(+)